MSLTSTGIYCIIHKESLKCYIGQSVNIHNRFNGYLSVANNSIKRQTKLYRAFQKYGRESFDFEIIEKCSEDKLNEREIFWIAFYDSVKNGYNLTYGGEGGKKSEETKQRMSEAQKISQNSDYMKKLKSERMSGENNPMFGKEVSLETKEKISNKSKEMWRSDGFRDKHTTAMDILRSDESYRMRLSEGIKKSYENNPEYREKISKAMKGRIMTEEHKSKIGQANVRRFSNPDARKAHGEKVRIGMLEAEFKLSQLTVY